MHLYAEHLDGGYGEGGAQRNASLFDCSSQCRLSTQALYMMVLKELL